MRNKVLQVITTVSKKSDAVRIIRLLLETKCVACCQMVGPIASSYWWKGKICEEQEYQILAKTTAKHYLDVEKKIRSVHPYEVPEIVAIPITSLYKAYKDWLTESLGE